MGCSCSVFVSRKKYDVFLSFRGEDTRDNFTSHLREALRKKKIKIYTDDEGLEKGNEISTTLIKAVKKSKLSVIIFSKQYASSSWCLDELVQILKCKEKYRQIVVPVFYGVDPSDIRKQKGNYKIEIKGSKITKKKVRAWKTALNKAANISGWDSRHVR